MWSIHEPPFLQGIARHGLGSKEEKNKNVRRMSKIQTRTGN